MNEMSESKSLVLGEDVGSAFPEPGGVGMTEFAEGFVFDLGFGCDGLEPSE